ncbi:MAG TPA: hypothetical protein VEL76_34710, partial [Gemmataceae bacterium]|nr:hypothetical protein [Gemmataceae bacterium]
MKFDKDFAVKQKFWLLLAGAAFFMVVGIFVLFFIAPRATATIKDKVKKDWDSFKKPGDVKNPLFVEEARKRADIEEKKKTEVWKLAAKDQERLFTWPAELAKSTNGLRAIEVNVVGKDPAKLNELNDDTNPDKGVHTFHGILQKQTNPEWIVVSKTTKEGKPVSRTFYRTPKVKVVAPEKDKEFKDLNAFDGSVVSVVYQRGVYSYDELTDSEQGIFANDKKGYRTQLLDVLKEAGPLNELDELVVQSRMDPSAVTRTGREGAVMPPPIVPGPRGTTDLKWAFKKDGKLPPSNNRVFHWVEKWERGDRGRDDISEEVWLAQEDLWIYRELFRLVKKANDYVANFEQIEGGKPGDAKFVGENPYLKIALSLEGDDKKQVKIQLTNKLNSLQPLTSQFAVQLTPGGEYKVLKPLDAPALLPAGPDAKGKDSSEEKTLDLRVAYPVKGIYGVRQVLTWETAAVKRIDQICIGTVGGEEWSLPHRLAHKLPLLAF